MSLEETARKLAKNAVEPAPSWDAERVAWLAALDCLYADVAGWLSPLAAGGLVSSERTPVRLSEPDLGVYGAPALVLTFTTEAVVLQPVGRQVFGVRGRVDVFRRGAREHAQMLLLVGERAAPCWEIWPSRDASLRKPLDHASFENLLDTLLLV